MKPRRCGRLCFLRSHPADESFTQPQRAERPLRPRDLQIRSKPDPADQPRESWFSRHEPVVGWPWAIFTTLIIALFVLLLVAAVWVTFDCSARYDRVSAGTVTDMGYRSSGKHTYKYACWVDVKNEAGESATWYVSDTFYNSVKVGDYVEKPKSSSWN